MHRQDGLEGYPSSGVAARGNSDTSNHHTGYMHNRARLITSNFLNRMLGMDWRLGEKYFAKMLTDYDPSVNNGNWQWIASTGVDPKPYFQRLFNPIIQSEKFDKNCEYILKWVPELKDVPIKDIHKWESKYKNYDYELINPCSYEEFLFRLGQNEGFVFFPKTPETLSRIIVEARMMDMKVITNNLPGAVKEPWFEKRGVELIEIMRNKRKEISDKVINIFEE